MRGIRRFISVTKIVKLDKVLIGFLLYIVIISLVLWFVEPSFHSVFDGIWYCFAVITTTGFGDIVAVTIIGKILTIILGLYSLLILALVTSSIVNYYMTVERMKTHNDFDEFADKLTNLENLSKEELKQLSNRFKKLKK